MRWLCHLYNLPSSMIYYLISPFQRSSRKKGYIYEPFCQTVSFKIYFLPHAIKEWNKLDPDIRNAETYASLRKMFLNFIRPIGNSTYKISDPLAIKLLNRLRLGFSHLSEHKFRLCWLTESVMFLLFLNWAYTSFFSTLPKLHYFTESPTSWYIVRKQEFWQQHEYKYINCNCQIYQRLWKVWSTCFLTIIIRCITTRIFALISYIFCLIIYKWSVRYRFCTVLFYVFTFLSFYCLIVSL